jgi:hypothetical protein
LNKYFSSISKLDEENGTLPQFDSKTNNIIHEIHITENEIDLINIFISFQYILGFEELFNKKLSKLFSNFSFAILFSKISFKSQVHVSVQKQY